MSEIAEILVEKGVPIPKSKRGREAKGSSKYPFAAMGVGDSFFVKGAKMRSFCPYIGVWRRRNDPSRKFSCRSVDGGIRVWRVA